MKNEFRYDVVLGIVGFVLSAGGFYVNNNFVATFGVMALIIYFVSYLKETYLDKIEESKSKIEELEKEINTKKEIDKVNQRLAKMEGILEMLRNKKGRLELINPLTLTIALLLVIMLIMFLREQGIIQ